MCKLKQIEYILQEEIQDELENGKFEVQLQLLTPTLIN